MILLCNILGLLGYVRVMQYFDALVVSVTALVEPVAAEFMAFTLGVLDPCRNYWAGLATL
jgi:hypothetical protein